MLAAGKLRSGQGFLRVRLAHMAGFADTLSSLFALCRAALFKPAAVQARNAHAQRTQQAENDEAEGDGAVQDAAPVQPLPAPHNADTYAGSSCMRMRCG